MLFFVNIRPKKKCVFTVACQKNLGSVGINFFFLLSAKLEMFVPESDTSPPSMFKLSFHKRCVTRPKKNMCVYGHMSKKSRVGRH
jgi:phosphoserine aminotransferase